MEGGVCGLGYGNAAGRQSTEHGNPVLPVFPTQWLLLFYRVTNQNELSTFKPEPAPELEPKDFTCEGPLIGAIVKLADCGFEDVIFWVTCQEGNV